ncbi:MAG: putative peptide zinc metalloprotease protein [Frankiaceae bacterium]|nr:putative peptide zinc metalloprotease protein [Frankiaceae bacterium]
MTLAPERTQDASTSAPASRTRVWGSERRHPAPPRSTGSGGKADKGAPADDRPKLADGVELVGEYEGSGYKEPHYLARRGATGIVQLSHLLHLVAEQCDGRRSYAEIAAAVSDGYGKPVSEDNVRTLVNDKLRALGVVASTDGRTATIDDSDPLLGLKFKVTLLGPRAVNRVVRPLTPLFWVPVVVLIGLGLAAFDGWLFFGHGLAQGLRKTVQHPIVFLVVGALVVVSAAMHELGHAGALRAGGGKPGRMGAGLYLAWPAFYTDVTDAYSLNRRGRLRTDLGGVYFNAIAVLGCAGVYALTRFEPLLLICFVLQMQVLQQMLPLLRLDGYYVLSDLLGVPDLFKRTGPVLKGLIPGRERDPLVNELTPKARRIITWWTLAVVPLLLANLLYIVVNAPRILATAWDSAAHQIGTIQGDHGAARAVAALQLLILLIPITGICITLVRVSSRTGRAAWSWSAGSPAKRLTTALATLAFLGLLVFAWWPDGSFTPYRPGDTGTVAAGFQDIGRPGVGTPELRSPREARQPLPAQPGSTGTTTDTSTTPGDNPAPEPSASAGTGAQPDPVGSAQPTPSTEPSTAPSATATP